MGEGNPQRQSAAVTTATKGQSPETVKFPKMEGCGRHSRHPVPETWTTAKRTKTGNLVKFRGGNNSEGSVQGNGGVHESLNKGNSVNTDVGYYINACGRETSGMEADYNLRKLRHRGVRWFS